MVDMVQASTPSALGIVGKVDKKRNCYHMQVDCRGAIVIQKLRNSYSRLVKLMNEPRELKSKFTNRKILRCPKIS